MKRHIITLVILVSMLFTGCTVAKSVVSKGADLSKYRYVAVIDNDIYRMPPELMQYQIQLYDAIEQSGLDMVGQYHIDELTEGEQSSLLLATIGVSVSEEKAVITVNFMDFKTDRPLVSCQASCTTFSLSSDSDLRSAIRHIGEQISKTFRR